MFGAASTDASGWFGSSNVWSVYCEDSCFPPWHGGVPGCGESWEGGRQQAAVLASAGEETPGIVLVTQERTT